MSKQTAIIAAAALLLGCLAVGFVGAEEEQEREVTLAEVPEAAKETILKEAGENEIQDIEEVQADDKLYYEADWLDDGQEVEIRVALDGTLMGREGEDGNEGGERDDDGDDDGGCSCRGHGDGDGHEDDGDDGDGDEHDGDGDAHDDDGDSHHGDGDGHVGDGDGSDGDGDEG